MTDASTLVLLTIPLFLAAAFDWYVAQRYVIAAVEKPYIPNLTAGAAVRVGIAVAVTIAAFLGAASLWLLITGQRVIPQPWGTVALYAIAIVPSLANLTSLGVLRRDDE